MVGIYQIVNTIDGKRYVGQSVDLDQRRRSHFSYLSQRTHYNKHLQRAANKYGVGNFEFKVLLLCDKENLTLYEQMCVDGLNPEYNICRECVDSSLGMKHTEETRKKMSESQRIRHTLTPTPPVSNETRKKMSEAKKGKKSNRAGIKHTEETRQQISKTMKERGIGGITGRVHSEETKQKISASNMGKHSGERRPLSTTTRQRMSEAQKIRGQVPMPEEVRIKIGNTNRQRWAAKKANRPDTVME